MQKVRGGVVAGRLVAPHGVDHGLGALTLDDAALGQAADDDLVAFEARHVEHVELTGVGVDPAGIGDLAAALGVERRLLELERHPAIGEHASGAHHGVGLEALVPDEGRLESRGVTLEGLELARTALAGPLGAAGALALLGHEPFEARLVDAHVRVLDDLAGQVERKAVGVVELEGDLGRQLGAGIAGAAQSLVEDAHPLGKGVREARLLLGHDHRLAAGQERRIGLAHEVDDPLAQARQKRLVEPYGHALLDGPPDDAPQYVVAALIAGQDAVHDQKGDASGVLGDSAQCPRHDLRGPVGRARKPLCELDQRPKGVGLVDRDDALMDGGDPLEPHARVDALRGQRREAAIRVHLVLHEDEVPVLHPAVALAAGGALGSPAAELLTHVEVQLGARPTGTGRSGRTPEVVAAPEMDDVVVGETVGLPDRDRLVVGGHLVVAAEHTDLDPRPVDRHLV